MTKRFARRLYFRYLNRRCRSQPVITCLRSVDGRLYRKSTASALNDRDPILICSIWNLYLTVWGTSKRMETFQAAREDLPTKASILHASAMGSPNRLMRAYASLRTFAALSDAVNRFRFTVRQRFPALVIESTGTRPAVHTWLSIDPRKYLIAVNRTTEVRSRSLFHPLLPPLAELIGFVGRSFSPSLSSRLPWLFIDRDPAAFILLVKDLHFHVRRKHFLIGLLARVGSRRTSTRSIGHFCLAGSDPDANGRAKSLAEKLNGVRGKVVWFVHGNSRTCLLTVKFGQLLLGTAGSRSLLFYARVYTGNKERGNEIFSRLKIAETIEKERYNVQGSLELEIDFL